MKRLLAFLIAWLGAGVVACGPADVGPETARAFAEARELRQLLVEGAARPPVTSADTGRLLALGYLERTRLGLGSPFRLADQLLVDPRLDESLRTRTAWAVLAMVYDGQSYAVDPRVLDSLFINPAANGPGAAAAELRRIETTVLGSESPRSGELAIRMAFANAGAERVVRTTAPLTAARAAAQVRDRALARADLLRLLRAARVEQRSPIHLIPAWRLTRRFMVERPVLERPSVEEELAAVARVPELMRALREDGMAPLREVESPVAAPSRRMLAWPSFGTGSEPPLPVGDGLPPLLSPQAARHLAALPQAHMAPPLAPIVVAVRASRDRVLGEQHVSAAVRLARSHYLGRAVNEELLVAEYDGLGNLAGRYVAEATLWAASALRPLAQEAPWFAGSGGPSEAELRQRFGLAAVSFDREVPKEWRPYYRRRLASALEDMQRVLPGFSTVGLGVHFGREPLVSALAVHDPAARAIVLPLGTGGGALAHELAHDLDWQAATRESRRRGEYSTDRAVREQRGPLAASVQGLTTAALEAPSTANHFRPPHGVRPTEVFAASADWFVAAALAREGRMNGYLTAVQDELLTGYAAVPPPDLRGQTGEATLAVLGQMTIVPEPVRSWFQLHFGRQREPSAYERARRVLEVGAAPAVASSAGAIVASVSAASGVLLPPDLLPAHGPSLDPFLSWPGCAARDADDSALARARRQASALAAESVARRLMARRRGDLSDPVARAAAGAPVDPALLEGELRRLTAVVLGSVERSESGC